jgi:hypothetical protein
MLKYGVIVVIIPENSERELPARTSAFKQNNENKHQQTELLYAHSGPFIRLRTFEHKTRGKIYLFGE